MYSEVIRNWIEARGYRVPPVTPYARLRDYSADAFAKFGAGHLPGWLGIEDLSVDRARVACSVAVRPELMGPHGFLHGGTTVSVADSMCGYGAIVNLPRDASGFVTIELKSNFLGTMSEGRLSCVATPVHVGHSTQVWDAVVTDESTRRTLAMFRCSQIVLRDAA